MNNKFEISETKQVRIVFPEDLNDHETLFGGRAMHWMDEVAYISAIRFARKKMVTVSVEKINFIKPIYSGSIIEIVGRVIKNSKIRIHIEVIIFTEEIHLGEKEMAVKAVFVFAAVNNENKPVRLDKEVFI